MNSLRTLLCLAPACAAISLASPHSAIDPQPRTDGPWQERQKLLNQRAAEAGSKAQVVFIGDSITQGWEGAGKDVWTRYYAHRNAVNLGIGGDRTQHVLWRLENGNLQGLKPKAVVLMIGTNNSNGEDNTVEQIADGVAAIVSRLRTALPDARILLVSIFPRSENPSPHRGKVLMVNQVIRNLADETRVFWIDFGHRFLDSRGIIPREMMPDYLHLTPQAYALWAESIEPRLSTILGDASVAPEHAPASANLSGEWIWTIQGPDGNPVEAPLVIQQQGTSVTARFARDATRWLESENGTVRGNSFSWSVKRDRPGGEIMTYRISGTIQGDTLTGKSSTTLDGNDVTVDWSARRK